MPAASKLGRSLTLFLALVKPLEAVRKPTAVGELDLDGSPVAEDGGLSGKLVLLAQQAVNRHRAELCPEAAAVTVRLASVPKPCHSQVIEGSEVSCELVATTADGASAVLPGRLVLPPTGGQELYLFLPTDKQEASDRQRWCELLTSSPAAPAGALFENAAGGWAGLAGELEHLHARSQVTGQGHVMVAPFDTDYSQPVPEELPTDFSVLTDFNSGKAGSRTSARCFPGGGFSMVTNQGECGSCWAHASAGAVADRLCLAGVPGLSGHGRDRTLSIQQVLSCARYPPNTGGCTGGFASIFYEFGIEQGVGRRQQWPYQTKCFQAPGDPHRVVAPEAVGIDCSKFAPEGDAPELSDKPCICLRDQSSRPRAQPACSTGVSRINETFKVRDYYRMPFPGETRAVPCQEGQLLQMGTQRVQCRGGQPQIAKQFSLADVEALMMAELYANGPYFIGFQTFTDFQDHWRVDPSDPNRVYIKDPAAEHRGGHAVSLVGWGVHQQLPYPWQCRAPVRVPIGGPGQPTSQQPGVSAGEMAPSFVPMELNYVRRCDQKITVKYWRLRNSWGTEWANRGYFHMRRGTNEVGVESSAMIPLITRDTAGPFEVRRAAPPAPAPEGAEPAFCRDFANSQSCEMFAGWMPGKQVLIKQVCPASCARATQGNEDPFCQHVRSGALSCGSYVRTPSGTVPISARCPVSCAGQR